MKAFAFWQELARRLGFPMTSLAIAACGGQAIGNGAKAGSGSTTSSSSGTDTAMNAPTAQAIDASTDSSAAQAIDAAPPVQDALAIIDAATDSLPIQAMDAAAPTVQDAQALDASPIPLDAFGKRLTLNTASCGMRDAEAGQPPTACPCMGAAPACSLPDAGRAECTSTDLQGQTCETLGFTGGTLGCDASCSFDTSGCDTCVAGPHTACASLHVGDGLDSTTRIDYLGRNLTVVAFALAASDTEVGLAWDDSNGMLHLTRLRADLTLLSDECLATSSFDASSGTPPSGTVALSLASTSTGWLIAAYRYAADGCKSEGPNGGTYLYPFDGAGRALGPPKVVCGTRAPNFSEVHLAGGPTLSSLPGGRRSLLTWLEYEYYTGGGLRWQMVEADGRSVTGPDGGAPAAPDPNLLTGLYSSVAVDDGFAVETEHQLSHALSHVAFDGTIRSNPLALPMENTNVKLAWSGSELRLLYQTLGKYSFIEASTGPGMAFLQRISAAGALIGNPVPIADGPGYALDHNALLALGPDSVVHVTQSANSHYSENLVRLDLNGVPVLPPVAIVRANYAVSLQTVAQGGDAAVAWTAPSNLRPTRIELARVRLTP